MTVQRLQGNTKNIFLIFFFLFSFFFVRIAEENSNESEKTTY